MKNLYLIDANSLIHRAYHALPPFSGPKGQPTGALYGLASVLLKILREDKPDFIAAFFDRPEPTFRKEKFADYKIHRPKAPDELVSQIIEAHELFEKFGIKTFEAPGYEADDLIGTAVEKFKLSPEVQITILTGDLDALQLIDNEKIIVKTLKKGVTETIIYDEKAVKNRYGIPPSGLPDYKGLVGDSSDNIPGVPGIGPKTASWLIQKYGSLENIFEKGRGEKAYEKIISAKEKTLLSRELSLILRNAPSGIKTLDELRHPGLKKPEVVPYFESLGFKSLIQRITPKESEPAIIKEKEEPRGLF